MSDHSGTAKSRALIRDPAPVCFDGRVILDSARETAGTSRIHDSLAAEDYPMTYLEVVFRYGTAPGENELRASRRHA